MGIEVRCTAFGRMEALQLATRADSLRPKKQEVLIAVEAAGVGYVDMLIMAGKYQWRPSLPFTPGGEVAGRVRALGEGCRRLQQGQAVYAACGIGGYAQEVVVHESQVFPMPEGLSMAEAAVSVSPFGTAYHALVDRADLQSKDKLLVLAGSGAIGAAVVQVGAMLGASVTATTTRPERLNYLRAQGADAVVVLPAVEDTDALREVFAKLPPQAVVLDALGGAYSELAFRRLAKGGRHLVVGFVAGAIPRLPLNLALLKGADLRGVFWSSFRQEQPAANRKNFAILSNAFAHKQLRPCLAAALPLAEYKRALHRLRKKDNSRPGKVALVVKE